MSRFDELRRSGKFPSAFLSPVCDALEELSKTKEMMDTLCRHMKSRGFLPRVSGWGVTMKAPSIHDFEILKPISKGAYGRVFLAQKKTTKDIYAIKVLKREEMITSRQRDNILLEVSFSSFLPSFSFLSSFFSDTLSFSLSHHESAGYLRADQQSLCRQAVLCIPDTSFLLFGHGIPPWRGLTLSPEGIWCVQ